MRKLIPVALGFLGIAVSTVHAADNWTNVYYEIQDLTFFSVQESINPGWQGYASVSFTQPLVWAMSGSCHQTKVAIRPEDKHMMAAVQAAYASARPLRIFVDDAQRLDGTICILRAVRY